MAKPLKSGGMFYINAKQQDGKKVENWRKAGLKKQISIPTRGWHDDD